MDNIKEILEDGTFDLDVLDAIKAESNAKIEAAVEHNIKKITSV